MSTPSETAAGPVTVVVSRDIRPGREAEAQDWMHRVIAATERLPGNLGATVLVPGADAPGRRTLVHRWANESARRAWEESDAIQRLLREAGAFATRHSQRATGLETWFTLPDAPARTPSPRWKMYVVTLRAVYALSLLIVPALAPWLDRWPFLISQAVIATVLTFARLALLTHLLRAWLYPTTDRQSA